MEIRKIEVVTTSSKVLRRHSRSPIRRPRESGLPFKTREIKIVTPILSLLPNPPILLPRENESGSTVTVLRVFSGGLGRTRPAGLRSTGPRTTPRTTPPPGLGRPQPRPLHKDTTDPFGSLHHHHHYVRMCPVSGSPDSPPYCEPSRIWVDGEEKVP